MGGVCKTQPDTWILEGSFTTANSVTQFPEGAGTGMSCLSCDIGEHLKQFWQSQNVIKKVF